MYEVQMKFRFMNIRNLEILVVFWVFNIAP